MPWQISVDRGLKWEDAVAKSLELTGPYDGFYLSYKVRGNKPSCLLAEQNRGQLFTVYKPNIGRQSQLEALDSLRRKFHRVGGRGAQLSLGLPALAPPRLMRSCVPRSPRRRPRSPGRVATPCR